MRHGTDLHLLCMQCGTHWQYDPDCPLQCPDCLDHLGEPEPAFVITMMGNSLQDTVVSRNAAVGGITATFHPDLTEDPLQWLEDPRD